MQPVRLVKSILERVSQQARLPRCDRADQQGGTTGVEDRRVERYRVWQDRARLLRRHRRMGDENRQTPAGGGKLAVELIRHDAYAAGGRCGHVVAVAFVGAGVDDVTLDVPGAGERRCGKACGSTATESDPHGDLAANAAAHRKV